jgi:hypothetical protein
MLVQRKGVLTSCRPSVPVSCRRQTMLEEEARGGAASGSSAATLEMSTAALRARRPATARKSIEAIDWKAAAEEDGARGTTGLI